MNSLMHDMAFLIAVDIFNSFSGLLRDEEKHDALWTIYECVRSGLTEYESKADRRMRRLNPCLN